MDLRAHLLDLVRPFGLGDEVCDGFVMTRISTELGARLTLRSNDAELHVEVAPLDRERPFAASSDALAFSYREGRCSNEHAMRVCEALAAAARENESTVLESMRGQPEDRVREVEVQTLLEPMGDADRFYGLSPYVGCLIGCRFCYAQSRLAPWRSLQGLAEVPWGSWVDVRVNAAEVLARELVALEGDEVAPIKFCPIVSDPYHALESRYRLSRQCIEVLVDYPAPVFILSRSAVILEDLDRIAALHSPYVGVSMPSQDDEVRAHFEPRASSVKSRLEVLRQAKARGIRTFAVVQPMLSDDADALARALAESTDSVSADVLRGEQGAGAEFDDGRFAHMRDADWQAKTHRELCDALRAEGVALWNGELPQSARSRSVGSQDIAKGTGASVAAAQQSGPLDRKETQGAG